MFDCFTFVSSIFKLDLLQTTISHFGAFLIGESKLKDYLNAMRKRILNRTCKWIFINYCRDEERFDWQKTITNLREYNNDILVEIS